MQLTTIALLALSGAAARTVNGYKIEPGADLRGATSSRSKFLLLQAILPP